jgi:hypothetical protein
MSTMRRIIGVVTGVVLAITVAVPATAVQPAWHRDVGDWDPHGLRGLAVASGPLGRSAISGFTTQPDGRKRLIVSVYGQAGARRWSVAWQPLSDSITYGTAVDVDAKGRLVAGGLAWRPMRFPTSPGWFLRSYGPAGRLLWARAAARWQKGYASSGISGVAMWAGGVVASGWTCGESGCNGGWVRSHSLDGTPRWTTMIGGRHGSTGAIDVVADGAAFVGGTYNAQDPMDDTAQRPFVTRLSPTGRRIWSRVFSGLGPRSTTNAIAAAGDRLIVGGTARGYGVDYPWSFRSHAWLARLDPSTGSIRWLVTWGHDRNAAQEVRGVAIGTSGWVRVTGSARRGDGSAALFVRTYRPNGTLASTWMVDPKKVDAFGVGIDVDRGGISVVGGVGKVGRLWRFRA